MNRLSLAALLVGIISCSEHKTYEPLTVYDGQRLSITSFPINGIVVKKSLYNGKVSLDTISLDTMARQKEIDLFAALDINKPGLSAYYQKESLEGTNTIHIYKYTSLDTTKTELAWLEEYVDENNYVSKVRGTVVKHSRLVDKRTHLELSFAKGQIDSYEISLNKQPLGQKPVQVKISAKVIELADSTAQE